MGFDDFVKKLPGGHYTKLFVATSTILAVTAFPIFFNTKEVRQGHDYFSQEKPEAIRAGQEQLRKEYRQARKAEKQQE